MLFVGRICCTVLLVNHSRLSHIDLPIVFCHNIAIDVVKAIFGYKSYLNLFPVFYSVSVFVCGVETWDGLTHSLSSVYLFVVRGGTSIVLMFTNIVGFR